MHTATLQNDVDAIFARMSAVEPGCAESRRLTLGNAGASGTAGVLGSSVTLWLSRRSQRSAPIVIFMGLLIASQLLLLANIDREGRAAVAGNVLTTVGLSADTAVAAGLTQGSGYAPLLSLASAACFASLALLWLPASKPVAG